MAMKESDFVILKKDNNMKVVQLLANRPLTLWKLKFSLDGAIGQTFGSSFLVQNGQLTKVDVTEIDCDIPDKDDELSNTVTKDNRNLIGSNENQQLSKEEIQNLRKQGASGEEIVEQLVEKSSTFASKNEFSQLKYIKKKMKKHVAMLTLLKPTSRNLIEMYYARSAAKICNLRIDSLSQILAFSNVQAGSRLMVIDACHGLVLGSVLERMNGCGSVIHLYTGSSPSRPAVSDGFHFSDNVLACLNSYPLDQVSSLRRDFSSSLTDNLPSDNRTSVPPSDDCIESAEANPVLSAAVDMHAETCVDSNGSAAGNRVCEPSQTESPVKDSVGSTRQRGEKRKYENLEEKEQSRAVRLQQIQRAKTIIEDGGMDGLIVAGRLYPTPIVISLLDIVKPSRPLVIFCPYKEPLVDCFLALRESGRVVMMNLSETWLRGYQVLPERTHPVIKMSGSGGFLLTATTVCS